MTARPTGRSDDRAWAEAVRREAVVRPPRCAATLFAGEVAVGAAALGLSRSQTLSLVRAFRADPATATLVRGRCGVKAGTRLLPPAVGACIDEAYREVFLRPERP